MVINALHLMKYQGGVYHDKNCNSRDLNKSALVVGYGHCSKAKKDYWLIKTSWGEGWGEGGYLRLARNENNLCGVATEASFPLV